MARRLRLQFPGARYHVINRGNLQHAVFATSGARRAFLSTLGEAAVQFGWRASAFVVMSNHYHLALETPEPNLVAGMHWLQSTFAIRLTRFHHQGDADGVSPLIAELWHFKRAGEIPSRLYPLN